MDEDSGLALLIGIVAVILAFAALYIALSAQDDARNIKQDLCAFYFEEDGSVSIVTDDDTREECKSHA